ncbi:MAG: family NAD(P)-dependent oxidoreductase [Thermoleophilia bacterium]|nr:family NAD(P)-dependent oxidoreductase [Thermoleophilia bacterium]
MTPDPSPVPVASRAVLITGASSGIGRAVAVEYARRGGVHLLLAGRREDALAETRRLALEAATSGGVAVDLLPCDLADATQRDALAARMHDHYGRLDVLVNNAGVGSSATFEHAAGADDTDHMLDVNLRSPLQLARALFDLLEQSGGALINVASVAGIVGSPDAPVYAATKWGLLGASESLHLRWKPHGVYVGCVLPGPVPTPGWPHAKLSRSLLGRLASSSAAAVATAIVDASEQRRAAWVIRPRAYVALVWLRAVSPPLLRRLITGARRHRQD